MRTLLRFLDTLAAWKLIVGATLVMAAIGVGGSVALILANPGGYELAQILSSGSFIALLLLFVRRRQYDSWSSGVQLSTVVFSAGWVAIITLRFVAPAAFEGPGVFGLALGATVLVAPLFAAVWALVISISRRLSHIGVPRANPSSGVRSNEELKPTAAPSSLVE